MSPFLDPHDKHLLAIQGPLILTNCLGCVYLETVGWYEAEGLIFFVNYFLIFNYLETFDRVEKGVLVNGAGVRYDIR